MRERCGAADQLVFIQTGHLAKGRVDVGDAALQVEGAHAGQHGIFHRAPKVGFRQQGLLGLDAATGMAPVAQQHPDGQCTQCADQPEETAADHAERSAITFSPNQEAIANRGNRYFVFGSAIGPGQ